MPPSPTSTLSDSGRSTAAEISSATARTQARCAPRSMPFDFRFEVGGKRVRLVHGSPRKVNEYLLDERPPSVRAHRRDRRLRRPPLRTHAQALGPRIAVQSPPIVSSFRADWDELASAYGAVESTTTFQATPFGSRRAGMVSGARAGRDRLPLPRRGGRRVGAATPRAGTGDVPRGRGRATSGRIRASRDLFGQRGLPRPSGAARAAARARDNDRRTR
jgi:hypothetical protein